MPFFSKKPIKEEQQKQQNEQNAKNQAQAQVETQKESKFKHIEEFNKQKKIDKEKAEKYPVIAEYNKKKKDELMKSQLLELDIAEQKEKQYLQDLNIIVDQIFNEFDIAIKGGLSKTEAMEGAQKILSNLGRSDIWNQQQKDFDLYFNKYDSNNKGYISKDDLKAFIKSDPQIFEILKKFYIGEVLNDNIKNAAIVGSLSGIIAISQCNIF